MKKEFKEKDILMKYNNVLITYEIEQDLIKRLQLNTRFDLIKAFDRNGYFLKYQNKYNGKGKRLYIPHKKRNY